MRGRFIPAILAGALLVGLLPPPSEAASFTYRVRRRAIKVCILMLDSARLDPSKPPGIDNPPENSDPHVWYILDAHPLKPLGWEFINPLAPKLVDQTIYQIWAARYAFSGASPPPDFQVGMPITKNMGPYWEVRLDQTDLDDLVKFDVAEITDHRTWSFTNFEREKLRQAVDAGATLWIDDCANLRVHNFFLDLQFHNDGPPAASVVADPTHPLLTFPFRLTPGQIANLGDKGVVNNYYHSSHDDPSALPDERTLVPVVYNSTMRGGRMLPNMSFGRFGCGKVIVTSLDEGCGINDPVDGGREERLVYGANSGVFCGSNIYKANTEDVLWAYNMVATSFDWTCYQRNVRHYGSTYEDIRPPLTKAWEFPLPGMSPLGTPFQPVVERNMVYVAFDSGKVLCFDLYPTEDLDQDGNPDDGYQAGTGGPNDPIEPPDAKWRYDVIWAYDFGAPIQGPPALDCILDPTTGVPRHILVVPVAGRLCALDAVPTMPQGTLAPTTNLVWQTPVLDPAGGTNASLTAPIINRGVVYVGSSTPSGGGGLYAVSARTGQVLGWWPGPPSPTNQTFPNGVPVVGPPALRMEFVEPIRAGQSGSEVVYFTAQSPLDGATYVGSASFVLWGFRFDDRLSLGLNPYVGELTWTPWNRIEGRPDYEHRKTRFGNWFPFIDFDGTLVDYSLATVSRWLAIRYRTRSSVSDPWGPWQWETNLASWAPSADPVSGTVTLGAFPPDPDVNDPYDYERTWEFQVFVRYACDRWGLLRKIATGSPVAFRLDTTPMLTVGGLIFGLADGAGRFIADRGRAIRQMAATAVGWTLPPNVTSGSYANGMVFAIGGPGGVGALYARERGTEFPLGQLLWNFVDSQGGSVNQPPTATSRAVYVCLDRGGEGFLLALDPDPRDYEKGALNMATGGYEYESYGWQGGDEPVGAVQPPPLDAGDPYFDNWGRVWEFPLRAPASTPPVAANGAVIVGTQAGRLIALSTADTLVVDGNRLLLIDAQGQAVWECTASIDPQTKRATPFRRPAMAVSLSSLRLPTQYLVADTGNDRVVVVERGAREVWELANKRDPTTGRWYAFKDDPVPDWGKNAPLLRPDQPRTVKRPTFAFRYASTSPTGNYQVRTVVADSGNHRVIEVVDEYDAQGNAVQQKQLAYVSDWSDIPALRGAELRSAVPVQLPGLGWGYLCAVHDVGVSIKVVGGLPVAKATDGLGSLVILDPRDGRRILWACNTIILPDGTAKHIVRPTMAFPIYNRRWVNPATGQVHIFPLTVLFVDEAGAFEVPMLDLAGSLAPSSLPYDTRPLPVIFAFTNLHFAYFYRGAQTDNWLGPPSGFRAKVACARRLANGDTLVVGKAFETSAVFEVDTSHFIRQGAPAGSFDGYFRDSMVWGVRAAGGTYSLAQPVFADRP